MNAPVQDVTEESGAHPENPTSQPTRAGPAIVAYLREHVSEFCYLEELRAKVNFFFRQTRADCQT